MNSLRHLALAGVIVSLVLGAANVVEAQGWMEDRTRREGPGLRAGNIVFHPGFGAEAGYDTNVFLSQSDSTVGTFGFRLTPHLDIATLNEARETEGESSEGAQPIVDFRFGASANILLQLEDTAPRNVGVNGDFRLTFLPGRVVNFTLWDDYQRTIAPFTEFSPGVGYGRHRNRGGLDLNFQSNGGIFSGKIGYNVNLNVFEDGAFTYANNLAHVAQGEIRWKFFPHSSLFFQTDTTVRDVFASRATVSLVSDLALVRARMGFVGAFTDKISTTLSLGYAGLFYFNRTIAAIAQEQETITAQAMLGVTLSPTIKFQLGYRRNLAPALTGNYSISNVFYGNLEWLIAGSFLVAFRTSVNLLGFGPLLDAAGDPLGVGGASDRNDILINGALFAEYRFTDWLALTLDLNLQADITDFEYQRDIDMVTVADPADYLKFHAWLGVRVFY